MKDENGNERTLEEKVVVYWSRRFEQRSIKENKKFLEFLEKLEESPANFRITSLQAKSLRKFLKKECVNTKTGEMVASSDIRAFIDFDKVKEYRKSLGYYQIVTSELTMDDREVIDKYHGLTQIEDQFRVMKKYARNKTRICEDSRTCGCSSSHLPHITDHHEDNPEKDQRL